MSINNRQYTANIKVYGYTGNVITLTADTDPLTLEENDDTDLLISLAAHGGVEVAESLDSADIHRCLGLIVGASADATTINYWLRAVGNHPDILDALPATHLVRWVRGCVTDA